MGPKEPITNLHHVDKIIKKKVSSYYSAKLAEHGTVPKGVDWNDETTQNLRFDQLLQVLGDCTSASVLDYGCGYGALLGSLKAADWCGKYIGFDWSEVMIDSAQRLFAEHENVSFLSNSEEIPPCDYAIASGIFNVKLDSPDRDWLKHIFNTLDHLDSLCTKGFAVNFLTSYSDVVRMRDDLYYANPTFILEHCLRRYSKTVGLLHDYPLFEFTVLIKKGVRP
ncbi:MAG: class I SAM-dependent methyltransferase [Candidatus Obscuribacterales bacterium]|jgi:SAM-dependent methyltransferase